MTNIKVITKKSKNPGKNVVILAGVHGNEICGVNVFDKLIPKIKIIRGKLTFIYANLEAIKKNKRFIEKNLNRCFLINQSQEISKSLEGKTARKIMPYLREADAMLDIHASNTRDSSPFLICEKQSFDMAGKLPGRLISYNWDKFHSGSTDYFMNLQKKIGICIECGYLGNKKSEKIAETAITNFLSLNKNINQKLKKISKKRIYKIVSMYVNKKDSFVKSKNFRDFEIIKRRTLIGKEGNKKIYLNKGKKVIFVRDCKKLNSDCFMVAEEKLLNRKKLDTKKEIK